LTNPLTPRRCWTGSFTNSMISGRDKTASGEPARRFHVNLRCKKLQMLSNSYYLRVPLTLLFSLVVSACGIPSQLSRRPDVNPRPTDKIEIYGQVPDNVTVLLYALWETTTNNWNCRGTIQIEGASFPYQAQLSAESERTTDGRRRWTLWRDGFFCWSLRMVSQDRRNNG